MATEQHDSFPMTFNASNTKIIGAEEQAASGKSRIIIGAIVQGVMSLFYCYCIAMASASNIDAVAGWAVATLLICIGMQIMMITGIVDCARGNVLANRYRSSSITLYNDKICGTFFRSESESGQSATILYTEVEAAKYHGGHRLNLSIHTKGHKVYYGLSIGDSKQAAEKIMEMKEAHTKTAPALPETAVASAVTASAFCGQCGAKLPVGSRFCGKCGATQQ